MDGFTAGSPTAVLMDGRDAMLAVGMNGEPLPVEHGFPVRMVVPGLYGYVSATKWITELELTTFAAFDAYWVPRGWSPQGPIKTESRIDTPARRPGPNAGPVTVIAGVAWAQHRGITKVEVRVDERPVAGGDAGAGASMDTWRQWSLAWHATPGEHTDPGARDRQRRRDPDRRRQRSTRTAPPAGTRSRSRCAEPLRGAGRTAGRSRRHADTSERRAASGGRARHRGAVCRGRAGCGVPGRCRRRCAGPAW